MCKNRLCIFAFTALLLLLFAPVIFINADVARNGIEAEAASYTVGADVQNETAEIVILMYHGVLNDPKRAGKYVISRDMLENDLVWLSEHGYTTVTVDDLTEYVYNGAELPQKSVMLTFDDGFYNNYLYLYPLLQKYNQRAVISIVGKFSQQYTDMGQDNPNFSYMRWETVKELSESGYVEIQNHSYCLHSTEERKGCARLTGEETEEYKDMFAADTIKNQKALFDNCGITMTAYAYPFGFYTKESEEVLKSLGIYASMTCEERTSTIKKGEPDSLYRLGRYNRPSGITTEEYMEKCGLH